MIDPLLAVSVVLALLLVASEIRRQKQAAHNPASEAPSPAQDMDTLLGWPPVPTRVLTVAERNAYDLLTRALPGHTIFSQVPLARFIKVPTRNSYAQWLRRVGSHCVDLIVADPLSQVIAVIEIRLAPASGANKTLKRHTRVIRVLEAAKIPLHEWQENELPTVAKVRELFNINPAQTPSSANTPPVQHHPAISAPPVDPANVTFYIANEALPDSPQQETVSPAAAQQPQEREPQQLMLEGIASRDKPATTWYDEFDDTAVQIIHREQAPTPTEDEQASQQQPLKLQYQPR